MVTRTGYFSGRNAVQEDGSLKEDYVWSFTTANPAISKVTPDANTQWVGPIQPVSVAFTQPMGRA